MKHNHILGKSAFEDRSATRYYDNPDLADLFFAIFNNDTFRQHSICLETYKAGVGGFTNYRFNNDHFEADYVAASTQPLEGKIAYHPILTISRANPAHIQSEFDRILNGIDNGQDGMPKLILVPVLMHNDHFGIFAIEPNADPQRVKVSYFNPMQAKLTYSDDELPMLDYMARRYPGATVSCNDQSKYQFDSSSCGPFVTEFARKTAQLAIQGTSPAITFTAEAQHCGMETLTYQTTGRTLEIRQSHATYVNPTFKSNYSFGLFVQAQRALHNIEHGTERAQPTYTFEHTGVNIDQHQRSCGSTPVINGQPQLKYLNHDIFEMQQQSIDWATGRISLIPTPSVSTATTTLSTSQPAPVPNIQIAVGVIVGLMLVTSIGIGVYVGL